jgi:hypothetical protein
MDLAQDQTQLPALMNAVTKFRGSMEVRGNFFLTNQATISFSVWAVLHEPRHDDSRWTTDEL